MLPRPLVGVLAVAESGELALLPPLKPETAPEAAATYGFPPLSAKP
jgi:hypothetical protein